MIVTARIPKDSGPTWRSLRFHFPSDRHFPMLFEPDEDPRDRRTMRHCRVKAMLLAMADELALTPAKRRVRVVWMCQQGVTGHLLVYRGEPREREKALWKKAMSLAVKAKLPKLCRDERVCTQPIRVD